MWKTAIGLIVTAILISISSYYFDEPITGKPLATLNFLLCTMITVALLCFIIGEITGNCSQVDKLWSILPIFYSFKVFYDSDWNVRTGIMFFLVLLWGIRLTYNFARRGGYHLIPWKGEEDYRWNILRQKPGLNTVWGWRLFHLFFITLYQNSLILLFTLPILVAWQGSQPLNVIDIIATLLVLFFIIIETIADQQQFVFHKNKQKDSSHLGFCTTGLWSYVRHPNYTAEQAIWISFYLFSVAATGKWVNWSIVGCLLLLLLFRGSSNFSEGISSEKYPDYKKYQARVPRFIPNLFGLKNSQNN